MFEGLDSAPPDPILGLTDAFKRDPTPNKINLGVGIFKDEQGETPTLASVREAEARLLAANATKTYLSISGSPEFADLVPKLVFGAEHRVIREKRVHTAHTPGGTGALRVAADFLKQRFPNTKIWVSDPTWENHVKVFNAAGLETKTYPYYDAKNKGLAFSAMLDTLGKVPAGDVVLLHACCHNPTGVDPTPEQWQKLLEVRQARGFLAFFDFAYQGFGDGIEEDAAPVRLFADAPGELLVANSFSKNFGLYNERVGGISLVGNDSASAAAAFSHVRSAIRANYSNPPAHGAAVVTTILADAGLRAKWQSELTEMRERIHAMRTSFVKELKAQGVAADFGFIAQQKGMFSFSGLSKEQVETLKTQYAIYAVSSGRINVAGITRANIAALCKAIASVL